MHFTFQLTRRIVCRIKTKYILFMEDSRTFIFAVFRTDQVGQRFFQMDGEKYFFALAEVIIGCKYCNRITGLRN